MFYQTRHLIASTDLAHGGSFIARGDGFHATEIDAEYLITSGKAKPAGGEETRAPETPAPALRRRAGRVAAAPKVAEAAPAVVDTVSAAEDDQTSTTSEAADQQQPPLDQLSTLSDQPSRE